MIIIFGTKDKVTIEYRCPFCTHTKRHDFPTDGFTKWYMEGMLVQEAFPTLSATDREVLISHICPDCQEKIFK